jgi:glycerophosphoryl diester phosphodiesterase
MKMTAIVIRLILPLAATIYAAAAEEPGRPFVVGHRGLMQAAPECTLAGFRACLTLRVGFEFDVRRTKDGELVCLHDATLDRTTDGRGNLSDLTLDQLRRLDAGSRFDAAFRSERVPSIAEIFSLVASEPRSDVLLAVDLKETGGGLEEKVVRLAEEKDVLDRLLFIGVTIESADVRARLRAANRQAHTARLAAAPKAIATALADQSADWVYFRFLPSPDDMNRIHAAGKQVFIAGPLVAGEEQANWARATQLGIDAILTDFPLELQKHLRKQPR